MKQSYHVWKETRISRHEKKTSSLRKTSALLVVVVSCILPLDDLLQENAELLRLQLLYGQLRQNEAQTWLGERGSTEVVFRTNWHLQHDLGGSQNGGFPQQPLVLLLEMLILGCFGGTTILGNPHLR